MCDGNLRFKLGLIRQLVSIDQPAEPRAYVEEHLTWSLEELKRYRARIAPEGEEEEEARVASDC